MSGAGKQKRKMPTRDKIADHWANDDRLTGRIFVDACWMCGSVSSKIERCHITPKNQGGSDTADNLHLLCSGCHSRTEALDGDGYWACFGLIQHDIVGRAIGAFMLMLPSLIERYDSLAEAQRLAVDEWRAGGEAVDLLKAKAVF